MQLIGILLLISSCLLYFLSFRIFGKRPTTAVVLLMVGGLLLSIYAAANPCLNNWDERYHALVAKHLADNFLKPVLYNNTLLPYDYTNWATGHVWLHKPPMALWLIAACIKLFGCHVFVVRIPSILLTCLGVKLTYDIAQTFYNSHIAFIAAFLFSINGLIIELVSGRASTDHVDAIFLFVVLLGAWLASRYYQHHKTFYIVCIGVATGAAVLTKWLPGFIIPFLWLLMCYKTLSIRAVAIGFLSIIIIAVVVAAPWHMYMYQHYRREYLHELGYNKLHFYIPIEGHDGDLFFYFTELRISYGELVYLPILLALYRALMQQAHRHIIMAGWFCTVYGFYTIAATKMASYTIIAAPAVFIVTAEAFVYLNERKKILYRLIAFLLLALPVRYTIERIKPQDGFCTDQQWNADIYQFARSSMNNSKTVVFNCPHYVELMFATDCIAYERGYDEEMAAGLRGKGYRVVVWK